MNTRLKAVISCVAVLTCVASSATGSTENGPSSQHLGEKGAVDIGARLELFVDDFLIDRITGAAERRMHRPARHNVIHTLREPWEGDTSAYLSVVHDRAQGRVLLYFNASPEGPGGQTTGVIVSDDGVEFTAPELGLSEFRGSMRNNLLPIRQQFGAAGHHFTPFLDENPEAAADARFKATARPAYSVYASPDGFDWRRLSDEPGVRGGPTDSQNVAFWDPVREMYVGYIRAKPEERSGIRDIRRTTSEDFIEWTDPELIDYTDDRREHLYTNGIRPYFRAPHIYIGLPNRFVPQRKKVAAHPNRGINDVVLMSSRDGGERFERWKEAFIRPGPEAEVWTDRNNYPAWGLVRTSPTELSLYWTEHYRHPGMRIRRGTIRVDGFVSLHADSAGGEVLTRPLRFTGDRLLVNYQTSAVGDIRFELTDEQGESLPGFSLDDSEVLFGNDIEHMVAWNGRSDLSDLAGEAVRLRVQLNDADLYAIRFDSDENLRTRLQGIQSEAARLLENAETSFAAGHQAELNSHLQGLGALLAEEREPGQDWLRASALLQRSTHEYRPVLRAEARAFDAIESAERVSAKQVEFGSAYQDAIELIHEELEYVLKREDARVEQVRKLAQRLDGAIADYDKAMDTADSATAGIRAADEMLSESAEGFGLLFQNRVERRRDALRRAMEDRRATRARVQKLTKHLNEAMSKHEQVPAFPPASAQEVPGTQATLAWDNADDWGKGLRVSTVVEDDAVVLAEEVSLKFDGEGDYVQWIAVDALDLNAVTVEAWVRASNDYYRQWFPVALLGAKHGEEGSWTEHAFNLWVDGHRPQFTLGSADEGALVRTRRGPGMELGQWQHLAGRFDGQSARLYINGRLADSAEYTGAIDEAWSDAVRIGGSLGKYSGFAGQIRDVRIWNTARTDQQIREHMDTRLTGDEQGLVAHWIAGRDAGAGDVVHNRATGDEKGRITGASWVLPSGYWLSGPSSFPDISQVSSSSIHWHATRQGDPDKATLKVLVGVSEREDQLPEHWHEAVNGEPIPRLEAGRELSGKRLWLKVRLASSDPSARVRLRGLTVKLE